MYYKFDVTRNLLFDSAFFKSLEKLNKAYDFSCGVRMQQNETDRHAPNIFTMVEKT